MIVNSKKFMFRGDKDDELPPLCRGRGVGEMTLRHHEAPSDSPNKSDLCQVFGAQALPSPLEQFSLPTPLSPAQQAQSVLPLQAPGKVYTPSAS